MTINIRFWHTICCWVGVCLLGMLFACSGSEELEDIGKPEQITYKIYGDWSNVQSETRGTLISAESGLGNGPLWITSKIHGTTTEYFSGESLSKSGSTWGTTGRYFWPATASGQSLDFLVLYPKDDNNWTNFSQLKYTVPQANASQVDLMYATAYNQTLNTNTTNNGQVELNMKHALTAFSFSAMSETGLTVTVKSVTLCNVMTSGTFSFPSASTVADGIGDNRWSELTAKGNLTLGMSEKTLNTTAYQRLDSDDGVLMMLPQSLTGWTKNEVATAESQTGSYLVINCSILSNGRPVTGDGENPTGDVYVPISGSFDAGKHYNFQMLFGLGYKSDGTPYGFVVELNASLIPWSEVTITPSDPLYEEESATP